MSVILSATVLCSLFSLFGPNEVRLSDLDLSRQECGWGTPQSRRSALKLPLQVGGVCFADGVGAHGWSRFDFDVRGKALSFSAKVGVDTGVAGRWLGSVGFAVLADGNVVARSPVLRNGMAPHELKADLNGARTVSLIVTDGGDNHLGDVADWCDAVFEMLDDTRPEPIVPPEEKEQFGILTPPAGPAPRINPPYVFGVRPGRPVLFRLPVTGARPLRLSVSGLPEGLAFDAKTGRLTGSVSKPGDYRLVFAAENAHGRAEQTFTLSVGERLSLTPPMGWNSWNCFGPTVSEKAVRDAAEKIILSGLADCGWTYVNVDDFWQNYQKDDGKYPDILGPTRAEDGTIAVNGRFGSLKALTDYIHGLGLKAGTYSSPGPLTCGGCTGSWRHEERDARAFADWGFDYLKYDWCSYDEVVRGEGRVSAWAPYCLMGRALAAQPRDIVFSLCQYGMDNVSAWGAKTGGQCWRTTPDIRDSWTSLRIIVEAQKPLWPFAEPGAWNDPDMLVVGKVGGWTGTPHPTHLTPNEQYAHISWWCLLSAPLMIGCDLGELDAFTLGLLTNPEMLEVNQDPLGAAAACVSGGLGSPDEVWVKPMSDGSYAVGLFNVSSAKRAVVFEMERLGFEGSWQVRELWRCRDEGEHSRYYAVTLPAHAPHVIRIRPGRDGRLRKGIGDVRDASWRRLFERVGDDAPDAHCRSCERR